METGIWLLRHGAVEANPEHRFVGQRDVKLSSLGVRQYERLAARLVERCQDNPPKAFFCSDLSRSMACAEILRRAFRPSGGAMPIVPDPALREISLGAWEGLTKAEVEKRYPGALAERAADWAGYAPLGGESFEMVQRRALLMLIRARLQHPEGVIVFVGHAGLNRTMLADYLALPLKSVMDIPQDYACAAYLENR